ncbi:RNA 2',3'-cyclic phosphodiesterase [Nocardiopsis sp. NRRL B-16309]|uniref:RNA 2',3'-cyclic phosphodiesterase n=1 Tax=Nocardiopsis sp. NRRL B-16309 TaxID=1519494 RepID=UPI0006AF8938|nr:RNA 2',3'-cyclic phosphodiesterase [Nocardiopsis sp. NRRL B-16309]KOX16975.1 2'-5' RNA ligase [Nocardiopsis sp. NRRL B-16309]
MRLFVALVPPEETLDALRAAVGRGRRHTPGLRWSRPGDWHITLVFLGEVDGEDLAELSAALGAEAGAHAPFEIAVRGWGRFPRDRVRSSVLWAGVTGNTGALDSLALGLRAAARSVGIPVDTRPYVPHVTVARSRRPRDLADTVHALGLLRTRPWSAREVHLVESRPGADDPYRTVRTWTLGWEPDPRSPERSTS